MKYLDHGIIDTNFNNKLIVQPINLNNKIENTYFNTYT